MFDQNNSEFKIPTTTPNSDEGFSTDVDQEQTAKIYNISKIQQGLGLAYEAIINNPETPGKPFERLYAISRELDEARSIKIEESSNIEKLRKVA